MSKLLSQIRAGQYLTLADAREAMHRIADTLQSDDEEDE